MAKRKRRDPELEAREEARNVAEVTAQFDTDTVAAIDRGKMAWGAVQEMSKLTLHAWWDIGYGVRAARQSIMTIKGFNSPRSGGYSKLMSAWLRTEGLHTIDSGELKRVQLMIDNRDAVEAWLRDHATEKQRQRWNSPSAIWRNYDKFLHAKDPLSVNRQRDVQAEVIEKLEGELRDAAAFITELEDQNAVLIDERDWLKAAQREPEVVAVQPTLLLPPSPPETIQYPAWESLLRDRVAELKAENAELRNRLAEPEDERITREFQRRGLKAPEDLDPPETIEEARSRFAATELANIQFLMRMHENVQLKARIAELEAENHRLEAEKRKLGEEVDRLLSITRSSKTVRARQQARLIETGGMAALTPGRARRRPSAMTPKMKLTA